MLDKIKQLINKESVTFLERYFNDAEFIDLIEKESSNDWLYLLYKNKDSDRIQVACLSKKGTDREPCFWGSLSYYVWQLAMDAFEDGYNMKYSNKVYAKRTEIEKEYITKYNLPKDYFWKVN